MRIEKVEGGYAVCADSTQPGIQAQVRQLTGYVPLVIADPPYGKILNVRWDTVDTAATQDDFVGWMIGWTRVWTRILLPNAAFYVWGGIGRPGFRPFFQYLSQLEHRLHGVEGLQIANLITWKKKRAYGVQHNYLFTREELAYLINGPDIKKPRCFNVPLLEETRCYAGYNPKYPAKSDRYRRSNVWADITEVMRGKVHDAQKAQRVMEIPIEVHTKPGEWVIDPFAGSGTTAFAARKLGRRFVVIEKDEKIFEEMVDRLRVNRPVEEVVSNHGNDAKADQDQGHQDGRREDQDQEGTLDVGRGV